MKCYIVRYSFNSDNMKCLDFSCQEHSIIAINEEEAWSKFLDWCKLDWTKLNAYKFPLFWKFDIREVKQLQKPTSEPQTV